MSSPRKHCRPRRQLLRQMAGVSLGLPLAPWAAFGAPTQTTPTPADKAATFTADDEKFLDDLGRANFLFFCEQASAQTGLIKDRANVRATDTSIVASVASTGFGLTAICIADKRGFIPHQDARQRVLATLNFLWKALPTHRGFFYHFANISPGA